MCDKNNDADLKLNSLKEKLREEIRQSKNTIEFLLRQEIKRLYKEIITPKISQRPESITLNKDEYIKIADLFFAISEGNIARYEPLKKDTIGYYDHITDREALLKEL